MKNYSRKINSVKISFRTPSHLRVHKSLFGIKIKYNQYGQKNKKDRN